MLGFSVGEIIIVLLVGVLIVGPKDLPKIARFLARCYKYVLNLTSEARRALDIDTELAEVANIKQDVEQTFKAANPVTAVKKQQFEIDESLREIQSEMRAVANWAQRNVKKEKPVPESKGEAAKTSDLPAGEPRARIDVRFE